APHARHALRNALSDSERLLPRGGLLVVISDALDDPAPLLEGLARLRYAPGHAREIALLQVLTADELDASRAGRATLRDPETGRRASFDADAHGERYRIAVARHLGA